MSFEVRTHSRIPFHALIVGSAVYPHLSEVISMGKVKVHVPALTRTADDVRFWREHLAGQALLDAHDLVVLGDDLSQATPTPVPVTSGEFLSAFQAMITRAAATGARPVLVYSGAGIWDAHKGAGLAFVDTELIGGGFIGVVWLNDLATLLDVVMPTERLHAWLDCGFHSTLDPLGSARTVTPSAQVPQGALRLRPTDAVFPISPTDESDESGALGTLTEIWSVLDVDLSEIDPGEYTFRILDIRPLGNDTSLGFMLVVAHNADQIPEPYVAGCEYWRWNSGTTPWPDSFRLVPMANAGFPPLSSLSGVERFTQQPFPAAAATPLPTSITGGPFYQLSKLVSGAPVALDAHFHHLVENNEVITRWYAAPGAILNSFLHLEAGASLVFTRLTAPPTGAGPRHLVSAPRL